MMLNLKTFAATLGDPDLCSFLIGFGNFCRFKFRCSRAKLDPWRISLYVEILQETFQTKLYNLYFETVLPIPLRNPKVCLEWLVSSLCVSRLIPSYSLKFKIYSLAWAGYMDDR